MSDADVQVDAYFAPGGPLAERLAGFRPRPQQLEMAHAVARAVGERRHLVVEAGTGVGKSLGYLVPALLAARGSGRRVVVSTHTISLQEQLVGHDIPLLESTLPISFTAALAKGRSNYLAPRRLAVALETAEAVLGDDRLRVELQRIDAAWRGRHAGTRQDLLPEPDPLAWESVQSEHGNCLGKHCRHFDDDCPFWVARRRLEDADLVVVNHSLYFSDLVLRARGVQLLPDHDVVVFDEAHTLEGVALEHFGARITRRMVRVLLFRMHRPRSRRGLLATLPGAEAARHAVDEALAANDELFDAVAAFCGGRAHTREIGADDRLADPLTPALEHLAGALADSRKRVEAPEKRIEIQAVMTRLADLVLTLEDVLAPLEGDRVHWAETGAREGQVSLHAKPLSVSEPLREHLFETTGTVVLTSATLSTGRGGGLDFVSRALGCEDADKLVLGSPFDFRASARLRVPTWLDEPRPTEEYEEAAALAILHYVERFLGGAFVLFTSYDFMGRMRRRVEDRLDALGYPLWVQGEGVPRARMLEGFRESDHSVLFGTDSFWQGVDVRGEALRLVIITRLPFPVPTQPLHRARSAAIEARGGSAFRELSLPEAIIKFKQGFGRLVRTESDHGAVVVLDTRILTKPYGRSFLAAIPDVPLVED